MKIFRFFYANILIWLATINYGYSQFEAPDESKKYFTADYINSMYYYGYLDHLRSSFNRFSSLYSQYNPGSQNSLRGGAIMYDFNYGRNIEGDSKIPMLIGGSMLYKSLGIHALISTTHMRIFGPEETWQEKLADDPKRFRGTTIGLSYNHKYASVLGDITYAQENFSYFGQITIPILRIRAGVGMSKYKEFTNPETGDTYIIEGDGITPDYYFVKSNILKFLNIGFTSLSYTQAKVSPYLSFSFYQLLKKEKWNSLKYDLELYYETSTPGFKDILESKDYEMRATFYYFQGKEPKTKKAQTSVLKGGPFLSVSYKSEFDYVTNVMRDAGIFYAGPKGWGGELGYGMRVLGLKAMGIDDETFLRLSLYYNYSEYFEIYPSIIGGIKFRVIL